MSARWDIPEELVLYNGRQFTSAEFRLFAEKYHFTQIYHLHRYFQAHYPESNGAAVSAVKIAKRILRQDDILPALISYRTTPIEAIGGAQQR